MELHQTWPVYSLDVSLSIYMLTFLIGRGVGVVGPLAIFGNLDNYYTLNRLALLGVP